MLRQIGQQTQKLANRICPPLEMDDFEEEEQELVIGYQNFFVMTWTAAQIFFFLVFLAFFLQSGESNYFMRRVDCCQSTELKFTDSGIPYPDCAQNTCKLYDFTWGGSWDFFDERPRKPENGQFSKLYTVDNEDSQYCCNLDPDSSSTDCCDFLPWNNSCGTVMWGSCMAAMCGMLMTQVLLVAFYSIFARRSEYYTGLAVIGGIFLRIFIFFLTYYLFFAFLFIFLFYWLGMMWCDNPYAYQWYKFGSWYFFYFFDNLAYTLTKGVSEYEKNWDMDAMVGVNTIVSLLIDLAFWVISIFARKMIRNKKDKPIFDFAYFEL